jgi:hypothetical protein
MIVPTKGVHPKSALLTIGGQIIGLLDERSTVSSLWARLQEVRDSEDWPPIGFDWFVLSLDLVFSLGAITLDDDGFVVRAP